MEEYRARSLGKTGITVTRLGVASSYGAPTEAFEEAFENGCNYFYYGSGRHRSGMRRAIKNLCSRGKRDNLVVALQTYARKGFLTGYFLNRRLKAMGLEYADILILGWHNKKPSAGLIDRAMRLKEKGLFRFLGISGHKRKVFPAMLKDGRFDLFHVRYNAAHRGAEHEVFDKMTGSDRPGIVTYTATRWGQLLNPGKMPPDENPLTSADCYRFAMSNPSVDVCLSGPKNLSEMRAALKVLDMGPLSDDEMERIKKIGSYVHEHTRGF